MDVGADIALVERRAVCGDAAFDRGVPSGEAGMVGEAPAACRGVLVGRVPGALRAGLRAGGDRRAAGRGGRLGLRSLHRAAAGAVRGVGWHPREGDHGGHHEEQRGASGHRHAFGQLGGHDRRGHAAHPARAARERLAAQQDPHRGVLHLPGCQHRRMPDAFGRPAAVFGLSARRALLLDAPAHLAALAAELRGAPRRVRARRPALREEGGARGRRGARAGGRGRRARARAHRGSAQPVVSGAHHRRGGAERRHSADARMP